MPTTTMRRVDPAAGSIAESEMTRTFAAFYEENVVQVTRALTATLGDPIVAQDAAQEAMAKACAQWTKLDTYDNPAGWCYRVGMNWATSRWRKRRREVLGREVINPGVSQPIDLTEDNHIAAALLKLPIDQREVIVLRLVQDWSIAETAEALGIPPGTVQSRYSRALTRLRQILESGDE